MMEDRRDIRVWVVFALLALTVFLTALRGSQLKRRVGHLEELILLQQAGIQSLHDLSLAQMKLDATIVSKIGEIHPEWVLEKVGVEDS